MNIAIIGSRAATPAVLAQVAAYIAKLPLDTMIISGGAKGVDKAAEQAARRCGLQVTVFRPDYKLYAKTPRIAPLMRNHQIIAAADEVVAFWNGTSTGTKHAIDMARKVGKPVTVIGGTA